MTWSDWLDASLEEYNRRYGENRRFHTVPDGDYDPGDVVEFDEGGGAYPHGIGGTNYIPHAVPRWGLKVPRT